MLVEKRNSLDHIDKAMEDLLSCVTSLAHWLPTLHNIISTTDRNVRGSQKLNFNPKFASVAIGNSQTIVIRLAGTRDRTRVPRMRVLKGITGSGQISILPTYLRRHYMQHAKVPTPRAATDNWHNNISILYYKNFFILLLLLLLLLLYFC